MEAVLSGDSGLAHVWEEICAQVDEAAFAPGTEFVQVAADPGRPPGRLIYMGG